MSGLQEDTHPYISNPCNFFHEKWALLCLFDFSALQNRYVSELLYFCNQDFTILYQNHVKLATIQIIVSKSRPKSVATMMRQFRAFFIWKNTFIQSGLSELFTACTLFAWVSSQNCALIYNHALSPYGQKHVNESKFMLTPTQVWRAFVLVSLLKDWRERGCILSVRDDGELNAQLKELMCERNDCMIAEGQLERLHACETCEKLVPTENSCSHMGLRAFFCPYT